MQQLRRRAVATDVDLTSNRPGEMAPALLSSSAQGLDERDSAMEIPMFEGRAAQVDLISLLSTGEARGANSILRVYWICVKNVPAAVFTSTLSCAVSLSVKLFSSPPS